MGAHSDCQMTSASAAAALRVLLLGKPVEWAVVYVFYCCAWFYTYPAFVNGMVALQGM